MEQVVVEKSKKVKWTNETKLTLILIVGALMLAFLMLYSVTKGSSETSLQVLRETVRSFDESNMKHLILRDIRIPRVIAGALVGAALSTSGAIMQGITRNPLADSGLLGLNAGAGFALALSYAIFPGMTYGKSIIFCFVGAALGGGLVNGIAVFGRREASPLRLILSGLAVSTLLTALSQGVALYFGISQDIMFWTVGGVSASNWNQIIVMVPMVGLALAISLGMSNNISLLNLGEDVAKGLGLNTRQVYWTCSALVAVLAGISVSIMGAIGFVGLIVPHLARYLVGVDYRNNIPASIVLGSILMVLADLLARTINPPFETPIGALISLVGVPFFLFLSRKERRAL